MKKIWDIKPRTEVSLLHQILANRGVPTTSVEEFLVPNFERDTYSFDKFTKMPIAVARLFDALANEEKIVIHGDYDADGVSGTSLLYAAIRDICKALEIEFQVEAFLPDREKDGYGVAMHNVERFAREGVRLLITVDCGIANGLELGRAHELGVDSIVCDHHQMGDHFPEHSIILHPLAPGETYPNKTLCGTGVAYKFACGLINEARNHGADIPEGYEKWMLDLVAVATVTDVMPLIGENRALEFFGLKVLQKTRRPGLKALIDSTGTEPADIDTQAIGFRIGPRLNAAGRLASAKIAFDVLSADTFEQAAAPVVRLEALNKERQALFAEMYKIAKVQAKEFGEHPVLVVHSDTWLPGIVGLVAGRLVSEFGKPAFAFTNVGAHVVGSGRSLGGLHLVEAMNSCGDLFVKKGGHPQACGLTLHSTDTVPLFREQVNAFARTYFGEAGPIDKLLIDAEVPLAEVTFELLKMLNSCQPFGEGNRPPVFVATKLKVREVTPMGATGVHVRLNVNDDVGLPFKLVGFSMGHLLGTVKIGDTIDIAYEAGENEWNGRKEVQYRIIDVNIC
jgi:single-stranded-DNA-specific exonuclease